MTIAEIDDRFRLTLPKEIRKTFKVAKGQRLYVVQYGDDLVVKPVPADPARRLQELIGDFVFDREVRKKAETWLWAQARGKS